MDTKVLLFMVLPLRMPSGLGITAPALEARGMSCHPATVTVRRHMHSAMMPAQAAVALALATMSTLQAWQRWHTSTMQSTDQVWCLCTSTWRWRRPVDNCLFVDRSATAHVYR